MSDGKRPRGDDAQGTWQAVHPMSPSQERFWLLDQLDPNHAGVRTKPALRLRGPIDVGCLSRALQTIVDRHEALRTTFEFGDGSLRQVVHPTYEVDLAICDLSRLEAADQEAEVRRQQRILVRQGFDLKRETGLRATLFRLGTEDHVLFIVVHHITSDGVSNGLLLDELMSLYSAFLRGSEDPLPPLPMQYGEYATRFRERLLRGELEDQAEYWIDRLRDVSPSIGLVTDRPRGTARHRRGASVDLTVDGTLLRGIQRLRSEERVSVADVVLAAWNVLLHRYTGLTDLPVGMATSGRTAPELGSLLGVFVNMVILRSDLSGGPSFRTFLGRFHRTAREAYRNSEIPFETILSRLDPSIQSAAGVFPEVLCTVVDISRQELKAPSLDLERLDTPPFDPLADLVFYVYKSPERIQVTILYDIALFDHQTIERMARFYGRLLEGLVGDPDRPVDEHDILGNDERRQLLVDWNATNSSYPRERTVHALFEEQALRTPQAEAVVCGGESLTYEELDRRANRLAHHLRALGVEHETLVGLCVERSAEMVVGILGILKAGGAYVPLDPSYPVSRLALMLEDTQTSVLLAQQGLVGSLPDFDGTTVLLDTDWPTIAGRPATAPAGEAAADSLAYIIYTSGSTGRPKGVCVEHRSVVRLVKNTNYVELGPGEVFLQFAPISFDASTFELWGSLLNGARLVIFPPHVPSLEALGRVIAEQEITTLWLTAALFKQMVDSHPERLCHVRQLLAGGEELSAPHVQRFLATLADRRLVNGYGPTENTTFTCCHVMTSDSVIDRSVPIGRPISNTQVYVLDKNMAPVPVGIPGRLYAGGDGLARCYLNDAELTARKFVPHPFSNDPQARLYDTGDQVRWLPDGTLEFLGRVDQQVKIRGFRIELGEIEMALVRHPLVREAAVLCEGDAAGEKRLVAFVVSAEGANPGDEDLTATLRASLAETLPGYMVPAGFAVLEALPLTANGKLDRTALGAVECVEEGSREAFVAPGTSTEQRIAEIWADLFQRNGVSIHDDFLRLGGHSLMAMKVISRLHTVFGVELPVQSLFAAPTIAGVSRAVDALRWATTNAGDGHVDSDHEDFEL